MGRIRKIKMKNLPFLMPKHNMPLMPNKPTPIPKQRNRNLAHNPLSIIPFLHHLPRPCIRFKL